MRLHSGTLERKWNRQLTRPIFPAGTKNADWGRDLTKWEEPPQLPPLPPVHLMFTWRHSRMNAPRPLPSSLLVRLCQTPLTPARITFSLHDTESDPRRGLFECGLWNCQQPGSPSLLDDVARSASQYATNFISGLLNLALHQPQHCSSESRCHSASSARWTRNWQVIRNCSTASATVPVCRDGGPVVSWPAGNTYGKSVW